jgi:hypothetical protein
MTDPTREMMVNLLKVRCPYADELDTEMAIYWFASDWHSGQGSDLYAALSVSPYHPGALERECPEDEAKECYDVLVEAYGD